MKRRTAIAVGVLLAVVLGGTALAWFEWTRSPTYSLRQIVTALEEHDRYSFEKYVNLDSLLQSAISDMGEGNALALAVGSNLSGTLKQEIRKAIEDGSFNFESRAGEVVKGITSKEANIQIQRQGSNAYFTFPSKTSGGAPFTLRIHLTHVPDGYWRIDRIANLKDLRTAEGAEEQARKVAEDNATNEAIDKVQVVAKLHSSIGGEWDRKNRFQVRLRNDGDKSVSSVELGIKAPATGYNRATKADVQLAAKEVKNVVLDDRVNQFIPETMKLYALGETEGVQIDVVALTYSDGTTIKRPKGD